MRVVNSVIHSDRLLPHRGMLPSFSRLRIDAHRSNVNRSFLMDLAVFGWSIHQLLCKHAVPQSGPALRRPKLTPAVTHRVAKDQLVHQLRRRSVRMLLEPAPGPRTSLIGRAWECPPDASSPCSPRVSLQRFAARL